MSEHIEKWVKTVDTEVLKRMLEDLKQDLSTMTMEIKRRSVGVQASGVPFGGAHSEYEGKKLNNLANQLQDTQDRMFHGDHELGDDRHTFASGAKSSGKKPNYQGAMPIYAFERFARQREYGDNKYGEDNYLKGVTDRNFILDRINHGIEHLLRLGEQVRKGMPPDTRAGTDDAAAVMCAGMFVMCYQQHTMALGRATESGKAGNWVEVDFSDAIRKTPGYGHGV